MELLTVRGTIDEVLTTVSDFDNDFTGENPYLWDEAIGYDSNREYLFDQLKDYHPIDKATSFIERWMEHDCYYRDYKWSLREIGSDDYILSIAFVTNNDR